MNNTIFNHEISQQIQQERIDVLNETIDIMNRIIKSDEEQINILNAKLSSFENVIQIDKITIKTQEKTIKLYLDNINSKSNV